MSRGEPLGKALSRFEMEEWGTNDWPEIKRKIWKEEERKRLERMTGMDEEQADWEEGDE